MKRIPQFILLISCFSFIFSSCEKSETYAEKLKKERKIISRFLDKNEIKVTKNYPKDRAFEENEFYLDPSGVYIHVIDSGNGNRITKGREVMVRYKDAVLLKTAADTTYSNVNYPDDWLNFTYGETSSYMGSSSSSFSNYWVKSSGVVKALEYVGDSASVRLLIPFKMGSYLQYYSTYEPVYIDSLFYDFRKGQGE